PDPFLDDTHPNGIAWFAVPGSLVKGQDRGSKQAVCDQRQGINDKGPETMTDFVRGLKCRLCGKTYPKKPINLCTEDFGPLEVDYDYEAIAATLNRAQIERRPHTMWRFRELLPIDGEPTVGSQVGGTPLVRADRLAEAIGVEKLWVKNDAVNFP